MATKSFKESEWLSQGKLWSSAPPLDRKHQEYAPLLIRSDYPQKVANVV
jgi:hypothetical protein